MWIKSCNNPPEILLLRVSFLRQQAVCTCKFIFVYPLLCPFFYVSEGCRWNFANSSFRVILLSKSRNLLGPEQHVCNFDQQLSGIRVINARCWSQQMMMTSLTGPMWDYPDRCASRIAYSIVRRQPRRDPPFSVRNRIPEARVITAVLFLSPSDRHLRNRIRHTTTLIVRSLHHSFTVIRGNGYLFFTFLFREILSVETCDETGPPMEKEESMKGKAEFRLESCNEKIISDTWVSLLSIAIKWISANMERFRFIEITQVYTAAVDTCRELIDKFHRSHLNPIEI